MVRDAPPESLGGVASLNGDEGGRFEERCCRSRLLTSLLGALECEHVPALAGRDRRGEQGVVDDRG